ncbi:MAG: PadR family transcriptional regulator [Lysinibacillus sp.]
MSIQIYILGKLMQKNTYPYQLKKDLSEPIPLAQIANITESKLYYHFESLTKQGLIEPVEVIKEENRPDKQVFTITEKGRQQLPEKIYDLFEKAKSITEMMTGIAFIHLVNRQKVISILEYKLATSERKGVILNQYKSTVEMNCPNLELMKFMETYHFERRKHELDSLIQLINHLKNNTF